MRNWSIWVFLPILHFLCTAVGLIVVGIGRSPPYISIAGDQPIASCFFSHVMNFAAFVGLVIGLFRYLQLKPKVPWLNLASLVTFSLACFGMTLVGNFQLSSSIDIHNVGSGLAFVLGMVYCWLQSVITLRLNLRRKCVAMVRFLLSAAITTSMIPYFVLMAQGIHIHAARAQWFLTMSLLAFIGSFAIEFRHLHFEVICTDLREPPLRRSETYSYAPKRHSDTPERHSDTQERHSDTTISLAFGLGSSLAFGLGSSLAFSLGSSLAFGLGTLTTSMLLYFVLMAQGTHIHAARALHGPPGAAARRRSPTPLASCGYSPPIYRFNIKP
ncbi:hypothetical protein NHX12_027050 [Muraenolepis orangiensis]|uniref:CWH43-like N-terminal domain-containing protein n=1 Tax=Muraenolepis orangiensis TaxID=630683 RepID=A0A9Q0ECU9_9TELE|nr:hypothetical protein NHX12_027050 [Muraenolepis orangiensis]